MMIGEWLSDIRNYFEHRLRNPVLAPFTIAWIVANWRLVLFLSTSDRRIEEKIVYVEENYLDVWHVLIYPLAFSLFYALILPWIHLHIEQAQDKANLKRRKNRLRSEAEYLRASVDRAEAEAILNGILAQDEITRRRQEELEQLERKAEQADSIAQDQIKAMEAEYKSKLQEYEASREADHEVTAAQRAELDKLQQDLARRLKLTELEQERVQSAMRKKEKQLEERLARSAPLSTAAATNVDFESVLSGHAYRLFHNPKVGPERSKEITFEDNGEIGKGRNRNEHSWRVVDGTLEILQADGNVHSRFHYLPSSRIFVNTDDEGTRSARGQYIIPEPPS